MYANPKSYIRIVSEKAKKKFKNTYLGKIWAPIREKKPNSTLNLKGPWQVQGVKLFQPNLCALLGQCIVNKEKQSLKHLICVEYL